MEVCTKNLSKDWNFTLKIVLGKKRQECSTLELYSLANAHTWTNGLAVTWVPVTKSLCFKSPNRSLQSGNEPSLIQRKNKVNNGYKNCISKVGLSCFPNNGLEPIPLMKETFLKKTQNFSRTNFIQSLPLIQNNSPLLHQKMYCMYCEILLFYAFNV